MGATGNGCVHFLSWGEDMSRFPHLTANGNESEFPNIGNIRTYDYDNSFDYSRFDNVQMNITLCKVPWDMGEAHVGNRTISGIGNVVHFGTKEKRDAWFAAIPDSECYRFATKYKQLHRDNSIVVPIPFDVAARYNYIAVEYEPFASEGDFVEYENTDSLENWYWFVREVEFLAPNSTKLHLLNDAWQTFIYDMDIPYMMLERGHYGMNETNADTFLSDPVNNCRYLLSPEMEEPTAPRIATSTHEHVFNTGTMYAVIITSSLPYGTWGSKGGNDWAVPGGQSYAQGVNSYYAFAVAASDFLTFINNMTSNVPQFAQTVQAVCFVGGDMVNLHTPYTFCGVTCYYVAADYKRATVHSLGKSDFGYPDAYANIAKLYTYPYAVLVVTDSDGNETEIRIEDTNGKIEIDYCLSLVYPWLQINGAVTSTGKMARRNISFANIDARNMPIGGNWHELLVSLDVPTFGIIESAYKVNDYATHYDRNQQAYAADNAQANANASADTAQSNQNANAANMVNNAAVTTAGNSAVTSRSNLSASYSHVATELYNNGMAAASNAIIGDNATSTIQANEQQATVAAASGAATAAVSAVGAAASGNIAGAVTGVVNGLIGAGSTLASMNIGNALTAAQAENAQASNSSNAGYGNRKDNNDTQNQIDTSTDITNTNNSVTTSIAANNAATTNANASRDNTTAKANATRDRATVSSAISNQIAQASIGAPEMFGELQNGQTATTRPLALYSNVLVQDDYTLKRCGDDFLRYGYSLNAQIEFDGDWCPMPKFTYWKLTDFWVRGLQVPDMYVDKIRFFLFGGVTVWKKPEDIGYVSIYENR